MEAMLKSGNEKAKQQLIKDYKLYLEYSRQSALPISRKMAYNYLLNTLDSERDFLTLNDVI